MREAKEETALDVELMEQFAVYSDPARDPRGPTLSVVFIARARGTPRGGDDAADARIFPLTALPSPLCFDHARIIADYRLYRESGRRPHLIGRAGPPASGGAASASVTR